MWVALKTNFGVPKIIFPEDHGALEASNEAITRRDYNEKHASINNDGDRLFEAPLESGMQRRLRHGFL